MNLFSYDGKLFHFLNKVADCMILSVMWLIFSVPLFTGGAATAALYYAIIKVIREEDGAAVKTFWRGFRSNLKQGTAVTLLTAVFALLVTAIGSGIYAAAGSSQSLTGVYFFYLVVLGFSIAWLHYILSYIARFEASLGTVLKNSLAICMTNIPQSLSMAVLFILVVVVLILAFPASALAGILVPAVYVLISSYLLERIYQKYMPEEDGESETEETIYA